jgi:hypothetical protein
VVCAAKRKKDCVKVFLGGSRVVSGSGSGEEEMRMRRRKEVSMRDARG